jgi:hypothetical protein
MRYAPFVGAFFCLSIARIASAHTSVGGGGSTSDPDADCLRWEAVPLSAADAAVADGGVDASADAGDAGTSDAGTTTVAVKLRCVEHATMFGCSCALGVGPAQRTSATATALVVAVAVLAAGSRRRPKRRRRSGEVTP